LVQILDDYLVSIEQGAPADPEELLARNPDDAEDLRGYLSGLQLFHAAVAPQAEPHTTEMPACAARVLGDYRLLREIGRGGMGVVYEAWQVSLRRRVAIKVLPFTAAADARQIGRFKNEAQAAAQVLHPNIVPIYAVGDEDGVHYYAMQLVNGQSLASLLESMRPGTAAGQGTTAPNNTLTVGCQKGCRRQANTEKPSRNASRTAAETADHIRVIAQLGQQAAEALHAAHEYGVVHRDVKPSNLLLDDHGKLWVTDFGLARCRDNAGLTQTGDVLGTMRYMSPEQATGRIELIDHRTDIYSLGVTLYELATLHHPADGVSNLACYFRQDRSAPQPLRQRNRHIPPGFQTIVLKAIAENPQERYTTAQKLAEDLARFLNGKPILASPPSVLNRAGRWAKRHRGLVGAAAAMVLVALSAAFVTQKQHVRATQNALDKATAELRLRGAVLDRFATRLVDQLEAIPGAEGVRQQLLEDSIDYYRQFASEAAEEPLLQTELAIAYSKLGGLSDEIGDRQQALASHKKAVALWEESAARDSHNEECARNLARARNDIGQLLAEMGQLAEARQWLDKANALQQSLLVQNPVNAELQAEIAATRTNLGLVLTQLGARGDAAKEFAGAIAIQQPLADSAKASESALRSLAATYNNYALLHSVANPKVAADAYQKALAIQLKLVKDHSINRLYQGDLARTYSNLGFLASQQKTWKKAELCYTDAIRIQENLVKMSPLAGAYRRDLAISYNNLGMAQSRHDRLAEAESSFRQAVRLQEMLLVAGRNDPQLLSNQGSVWNNLGMLLDRQRQSENAEKAYREAVHYQRQAFEAVVDNEHYRLLLSKHLHNLAGNLHSQSKHDAALKVVLARKALWPKAPDRLFAMAQEMVSEYRQLAATPNLDPSLQPEYERAVVGTLRDALAAGMPSERLTDSSLGAIASSEHFKKLLTEAKVDHAQ
jgi:serine/threonine protein kinase/tetratricopeptide (TPR) repeat protein